MIGGIDCVSVTQIDSTSLTVISLYSSELLVQRYRIVVPNICMYSRQNTTNSAPPAWMNVRLPIIDLFQYIPHRASVV